MSAEPKINTHAVYNAVWDVNFQPAAVKLVALAYAKHADPDGTNCFPGRARIMAFTGYGEDVVRDVTAFLLREEIGALQLVRKHTFTTPAKYCINLAALHELAQRPEVALSPRPRKDREGGAAPRGAHAQQGAGPADRGARVHETGGRAPTQPSRHQPGQARGGLRRPSAGAEGVARQEGERRDAAFFLQEAD